MQKGFIFRKTEELFFFRKFMKEIFFLNYLMPTLYLFKKKKNCRYNLTLLSFQNDPQYANMNLILVSLTTSILHILIFPICYLIHFLKHFKHGIMKELEKRIKAHNRSGLTDQ